MDRDTKKQILHGFLYGHRPPGETREMRITGGTPQLRRDAAFELGRMHRARDSWGPRGKTAVFQDQILTRAYQSGYYSPYWWERNDPRYRMQDYHPSKRIAYFRWLRAVHGTPALVAWRKMQQHFGGWRDH